MRITHRMIADSVNFNLQRNLRRLEFFSNQMSTGKVFQRPSENPVGVGRVMSYTASIYRNEQFRLNMNQSRSWLENTEYSLQNGLDVLQRIRELSIHGANESLTAEDRRSIAPEVFEFIDHLIGIANSESNGLYFFGGHQTLKAPFVRENVYGIHVNHLEQDHLGHALFEAGVVGAGGAGREIGLEFTIDGTSYRLSARAHGSDSAATFNNIRNAVEAHAQLSKLINIGGDHTAMTMTRITPGDFTVEAVTDHAAAVIQNLSFNTVVTVNAFADNITALNNLNPNSFLPGNYHIETEDTQGLTDQDPETRLLHFFQSGDIRIPVISAEAAASRNQSISFVVTAISGINNELITLSYEYLEMDPATGLPSSGTGSVTVDKTAGAVPVSIGGVNYDIDLAAIDFTLGDRIVANTNAFVANADNADLVRLYRDGAGEPEFSFAFHDATLSNGTHGFSFFALDQDSGALVRSSFDITWANFQTRTEPYPAAGFSIGVHEGSSLHAAQNQKVEAAGLQNGTYSLDLVRETAPAPGIDATLAVVQQHLSGSAESIFSGAKALGDITISVDSAVSASVLLEISAVNYQTGEIRYSYSAHQYASDGSYEKKDGINQVLAFGGAADQTIDLGGITVTVDGLQDLTAADTLGLKIGDRVVLNITPAVTAGVAFDRVTLSGEHRGGGSQAQYIFDSGLLENSAVDLRYFSINNYTRSLDKGHIYDGRLCLTAETLELFRLPHNRYFSYDSIGFPVYYGDDRDRIQEISPHQELIMNLSGTKAFGENQEIFEAVFAVYWALIDNDRETLGGAALERMDRAVSHLLEKLSQVGARSNRLEAMHNTLDSENLYLREVRSNIEDIDLAFVITEFTMQQNAYRAALSTASMMLQPSLVDYWR